MNSRLLPTATAWSRRLPVTLPDAGMGRAVLMVLTFSVSGSRGHPTGLVMAGLASTPPPLMWRVDTTGDAPEQSTE